MPFFGLMDVRAGDFGVRDIGDIWVREDGGEKAEVGVDADTETGTDTVVEEAEATANDDDGEGGDAVAGTMLDGMMDQ